MTARLSALLAGLALLISLGACVPAARVELDSIGSLASDETVVVGRVELVPRLRKDEQRLSVMNSGSFENRVFLIADDQPRRLARAPTTSDYKGRIEATLEKTFFVRSANQPFYILASMLYLQVGNTGMDQAYLPGNLRVPLRPGDKAVYIGTIRYHRNEFFDITRTTIIDDYDEANAEFKRRFGSRYVLRKALMVSVK